MNKWGANIFEDSNNLCYLNVFFYNSIQCLNIFVCLYYLKPYIKEDTHSLESSLKEMMNALRRLQALKHASLTELTAPLEEIETTNQQLNKM